MRTVMKNVLLLMTVICLTLVAVMPFGAGFSLPFAARQTVISETASLDEEPSASQPICTETSVQDSADTVTEEEETKPSALTEASTEENTAVAEDISVESDMLVPELYDEPMAASEHPYLTENSYESIYELYFFSENTGSLEASNKVNTYEFTLSSRCMFRYTVIHDTLEALEGWNVSLYEEYYINGNDSETTFRIINTLVTDPASARDSSVELGLMPGAYRLVVTAGSKYTPETYKIEVETKDGTGYEIECNDNIYRYTEVYSGVSVKGSASYFYDRQDEDWYLFRVYEDGFSEVRFSHPAVKDKVTVCWQVILYSESGDVLYSVNSLFTDEMNKSGGLGLPAGNYYILVKNRVYTDITYTLSVTRTDDIGFENESNDTQASANGIALNSTITGSVTEKNNVIDRDYFVFEVTSRGYAVIELAHNPISDSDDKNGWNFVLTDADGRVIYKGVSAWADDVKASPALGLGEGTYYVRIDSDNLYHSAEVYYLTLSFTENDLWETEYNGRYDSSDVIKQDISVNGVLAEMGTDFDYDWYTFELTEAGNVNISLSHEILDYSRNIFVFTLYDYEGYEVASADGNNYTECASDAEKTAADFIGLQPGVYYIKVTSGLFFDSVPYVLKYTFATEA